MLLYFSVSQFPWQQPENDIPLPLQVQATKDKLDTARLENMTDSEEALSEQARRHERERLLLLEENKKLAIDIDTVRGV